MFFLQKREIKMINIKKLLLLFFASLIYFTGCSTSTSSSEAKTRTTETTQLSAENNEWAYTTMSEIVELESDVTSVSITGDIGGKTLYMIKTNPTSASIPFSSLNMVSSVSDNISEYTVSSFSGGGNSGVPGGSAPNHFVKDGSMFASAFSIKQNYARSLSTASSIEQTYEIGDSRLIYVDTDSDIGSYEQKTAYLRALTDNCYVWVIGENYTEDTAAGCKIDSTIAQNIAKKFEAMYPLITGIFGNESDKILYGSYSSNTASLVDMCSQSLTGNKINIVVYDIGADYGSSNQTGVVGYFYCKDYYALTDTSGQDLDASNKGKYFYIDAAYAVSYTDTVYSTLAHEFQHMINFGQKYIGNVLWSSTWYNEMMSMICEDVMQSYLEIGNEDSPEARLPFFERNYYNLGISYNSSNSSYTGLSYANLYAFGAWLIRSYGGIPLIQQMSQNSYVNFDSVINAVNTLNGTSLTVKDLLKFYAKACIINRAGSGFNQELNCSSYNASYDYPIKAINLWNLSEDLSVLEKEIDEYYSSYGYDYTDYYSFTGPYYLAQNEISSALPAYGMYIYKIGTIDSGSVSADIKVSAVSNTSQKTYFVIQ